MEPITVESIIQTSNGINHSLVEDLLSGKKVVSELSYEDSVILQDAMFDKLKTKYQSIYEGFSLDGELVAEEQDNGKGGTYKLSPTNRIETDIFKFNFKLGWNDHFRFNASFDNSDTESGYTKEIPREFWSKVTHKPSVVKFNIHYSNGVDKGNAYGTKIDYISRSYKVKSLKLIMQRLTEIVDRFVELADELRPVYQKNIADKKQEKIDDDRNENQSDFARIHLGYADYVAMKEKYNVTLVADPLADAMIKKGSLELSFLVSKGSSHWINLDGSKYKYFEVFQK